MRYAAVLVAALVCSGAFASEPGTPIDCAEFVFLQPGYTCERVGGGADLLVMGAYTQVDSQGRLFRLSSPTPIGNCGPHEMRRTALQWLNGSVWLTLAYVDRRCVNGNQVDSIEPVQGHTYGNPVLAFDGTGGRLLVSLRSSCELSDCSGYPPGQSDYWVAAIRGFATTFDVLQTFTPQASLGFRVPYMPEGMAGADSFDTYWGPLTKPLDFTQAQPLACDYPATSPAVGDYLTVVEPLPDPAPGTGRYYVTSATHQGVTRYGRKTMAGVITGRDPALLPACSP